ncbi:hypothetical protein THAOC_27434 [Thalassiosira oceanica]|uniref:Uncharacterized protein n=1 Tax=Thalassiosira oceanica TaxID=159749 RepID=K0RHM4_THAOC|nr:hypothetical protein THAOC_27434 [Thalassiosira oceanica]|eukprot:EJK53183.1 hypothetical protein THAOC_27434 [Thalassiosira oceanica]
MAVEHPPGLGSALYTLHMSESPGVRGALITEQMNCAEVLSGSVGRAAGRRRGGPVSVTRARWRGRSWPTSRTPSGGGGTPPCTPSGDSSRNLDLFASSAHGTRLNAPLTGAFAAGGGRRGGRSRGGVACRMTTYSRDEVAVGFDTANVGPFFLMTKGTAASAPGASKAHTVSAVGGTLLDGEGGEERQEAVDTHNNNNSLIAEKVSTGQPPQPSRPQSVSRSRSQPQRATRPRS